ncbi:MGH1-like glycoside hydrolase domain-containing protein [Spirosoma oryzicola]|uniref:alpha-L-rhamnosidase-related protein n=1 Tax=Spirosoma oryzicola TaxID=2898794 RepID=UPI001E2D28DB|nr:alpha-L-rhamnosidase C-terminal domain-containing protein [Spirosoma oryzicola]UHG94301.1 alpha-rhamnosidase [Spirosoma oryzicola]
MRNRLILCCILFIVCSTHLAAQSRATWIWYPGDFEIWLSNKMQTKRTERNAFIPPFWRLYSHQIVVNFSKQLNLAQPEEITVAVEGQYNVTIDGKYVQSDIRRITLPAGKHSINFQVYNQVSPPSIYVQGKTIYSDPTWTVEVVHNNSADNMPGKATNGYAGSWNFDGPEKLPSRYSLPTKEVKATSIKRNAQSVLVDFGQETIGFVQLKGLTGSGKLSLYFGESQEEALSVDSCEILDHYTINSNSTNFTASNARAFRFVNIVHEPGIQFADVSMLYEYLPLAQRGTFKSSDEQLNKIWDVSIRTLELNTREFFLDGIKRDHWVWSGDAVQSYLMNYYSFFDNESVKRTTWALRGAEPVESHINTILDYSLYWFTGIYDYYQYTGDEAFLKTIYPRMVTLMDFVLKRRNNNGMLEGLPGDWVFLDWAPMTKEGELSAEQLLFARSLETMALCASLMNDTEKAASYGQLATDLKTKILDTFWDPNQQAFIHSRKDGQVNRQVTRYANMFATMFGYLDSTKVNAVTKNVLMNDKVQKITTPYMRFYELAALAEIGQQAYVTKEIKDYWGGMLQEGATTFWEAYDPKEKGAARYAMYGRPFGKSLCHAWGASPLYLLGKYYLGVKPVQPGYANYVIEPNLGGLQWIEGKVPTPQGDIAVSVNTRQIKVNTVGGKGLLRFKSAKKPACKEGQLISKGKQTFEMALEAGKNYIVSYSLP